MDDLSSKINELLSDPQAMQQLNSLAASLGLGIPHLIPPRPRGRTHLPAIILFRGWT